MAKVTGLAELNAFLTALPEKLEKNILTGAMRAAAEVVAEEARATAGTHGLDIVVKVRREPGIIVAQVRVTGPRASIAWWLEFGTAPHFIRVSDVDRGGRTIRRLNTLAREGSLEINGRFVGPVVSHPGARKIPFMRPALDRKHGEAIQAAGRYVAERLTKAGLSAPPAAMEDAA